MLEGEDGELTSILVYPIKHIVAFVVRAEGLALAFLSRSLEFGALLPPFFRARAPLTLSSRRKLTFCYYLLL